MFQLEKWTDKAKVQAHLRKLLRNITEEQKDIAYDIIFENYEEYYVRGGYQEAEFYMDLLRVLDARDPELKERQKKIK